jgi:RNA-binding protein YhbY
MVGQHGLSEAVLAELESTMTKHELLKIKIRAEDREDRQKMIDEIVNIIFVMVIILFKQLSTCFLVSKKY